MVIFLYWLKRLDAFITRTLWGEILSLLDNCSFQGFSECIPELSSVEMKFLSGNTTLRLQHIHASIIDSLKRGYHTLQCRCNRVLNAIYSVDNIYNMGHTCAMYRTHFMWLDMPMNIIANCWRICGLFFSATRPSDNSEALVNLDTAVQQSVPFYLSSKERQQLVSSLLKADDEPSWKLVLTENKKVFHVGLLSTGFPNGIFWKDNIENSDKIYSALNMYFGKILGFTTKITSIMQT